MTNKIKIEKNLVGQNLKNRQSWKKRTRGNCEAEAFQCQQKTFKKPSKKSPPPPEILKNPQETLPRLPKTFKKPSPETFLWVLAFKCNQRGGARACARAPPFVTFFYSQNPQKCFRGGFFEGFRGPREGFLRVFQNFRGRRRVFLGFFDGFLLALESLCLAVSASSFFPRFSVF